MTRSPRQVTALAVALSVALLAAACTSGGKKTSASSGHGGAVARPAAGANGAKAAAGAANQLQPNDVLPAGRAIIVTGNATVQVRDVTAAVRRLTDLAAQDHGYVADSELDLGSSPQATVTLLLPPRSASGLLAALSALGTVQASSLSTQDVSGDVADATSRVTTAQASVARVRSLLDRATTIGQVVSIEGELTKRESDLEAYQARLRTLTTQVDSATVTVLLRQPSSAPLTARHVQRAGFIAGLTAGWDALTAIVRVVLAAVGAVLPMLPLLAVLVLLGWIGWRFGRPGARYLGKLFGRVGRTETPPLAQG
jgi:hypothetical protein